MVVAQVAYNHLDSEVKAKCDALITNTVYHSTSGNSNFVTSACWADDIKSFTTNFSSEHFIDLPISLDKSPTDGVVYDPSNAVVAINQCIAALQDSSVSQSNKATALRFLIHFTGDIQQPLHASTGVTASHLSGDAGGNSFNVTGWSSLHSLWDSGGGFLSDAPSRPLNTSDAALISNKAAAVETLYPYTNSIGFIPDPMDWANESKALAQTVSYVGITNGFPASSSYTNTAQNTTKQRMAIGGQRLAKLLNTIFVTNAPSLKQLTAKQGNFSFSWGAVPGRIYRVQWKSQIEAIGWNDLNDVTASTNSAVFTNSIAITPRFYRIVVVN